MMIETQKGIDAVVVATPDHLHFVASMWAIKSGKHVYCEKPLTRTIGGALRILPMARMQEFKATPKTLPRSPGPLEEWLAASRGGPQAGSHFGRSSILAEVQYFQVRSNLEVLNVANPQRPSIRPWDWTAKAWTRRMPALIGTDLALVTAREIHHVSGNFTDYLCSLRRVGVFPAGSDR